MERPPGMIDSLFAGRSRAEKEADADAMQNALLLFFCLAAGVIFALSTIFAAVGLQLGWWSVPVFVPPFIWGLISTAMGGPVRPAELDRLRIWQRLAGAPLLAVLLWAAWPLWAGPAARAWRAHRGFGSLAKGGLHYPLSAILEASPLAMGLVAFLLLALVMVAAPRIGKREPERPAPPGDPEPLRGALASGNSQRAERWR
ncbi:MAG: hypothetical protein ACYDA6_07810 [Solirubrobacteraceae bacterium]